MELRKRNRVAHASLQGAIEIGTAVILSAAVLVLLLARLPQDLVLPAVGAGALLAGAGIALFAWLLGIRRSSDRISAWDFAGALLFVGFAATVLSRPEHIMQLAL